MNHQPQNKRRPRSVTVAGALQLLVAAAFLMVPAVGFVYGGDVQAAAEAEMVRQGLPADVLDRNDVRFDEHGIAVAAPVVIAVGLAVLALLNLAGKRVGRILSLSFQPVLLVVDGLIIASQLFAVRLLESAFDGSGDATLRRVDVRALLDAATDAYPDWLPYLTGARFVVTPLASVLVIILLVVPSANAYFRKDGPD